MNLNFDLNIGVWNVWLPFFIFTAFSFLYPYLLDKEGFKRGGDSSWIEKKDKPLIAFGTFLFWGTLLISIWIPLKTEGVFFYMGLGLFLFSMVLTAFMGSHYVTAPKDKVITQGVYRFSRNPIYIVNHLIGIAIIFMSCSWILIISTALSVVITHFTILIEERFLVNRYGNEYLNYKQKTPRYIRLF